MRVLSVVVNRASEFNGDGFKQGKWSKNRFFYSDFQPFLKNFEIQYLKNMHLFYEIFGGLLDSSDLKNLII